MSKFIWDFKALYVPDTIRRSLLTLWLFCRFLSGCPVVTSGTENRKEPQGLGELVQTWRVHDVIWGSGTAVSHCIIVHSMAHLCPIFKCCWEGARSQMCLHYYCCWILFFFPHRLSWTLIWVLFSLSVAQPQHTHTHTHTAFPLSSADTQTIRHSRRGPCRSSPLLVSTTSHQSLVSQREQSAAADTL